MEWTQNTLSFFFFQTFRAHQSQRRYICKTFCTEMPPASSAAKEWAGRVETLHSPPNAQFELTPPCAVVIYSLPCQRQKKPMKNSTPNWFFGLFCDPRSQGFALILTSSRVNASILHPTCATATNILHRELYWAIMQAGGWTLLKTGHQDLVVCATAHSRGFLCPSTE